MSKDNNLPDDYTYLNELNKNVEYWLSFLSDTSRRAMSLAFYGATVGTTVILIGPLYKGTHMVMQLVIRNNKGNRVDLDTTLH